MLSQVKNRIFIPTLIRPEGWLWENLSNNWLAVCAVLIGCVGMLLYPNSFDLIKQLIDKALLKNISIPFLEKECALRGSA